MTDEQIAKIALDCVTTDCETSATYENGSRYDGFEFQGDELIQYAKRFLSAVDAERSKECAGEVMAFESQHSYVELTKWLPIGTKLYLHPAPKEKL